MEAKKAAALFDNMSAVEKMEELALRNANLLLKVRIVLFFQNP
jgi:hypothetical protein